jgi:hypothetical protein
MPSPTKRAHSGAEPSPVAPSDFAHRDRAHELEQELTVVNATATYQNLALIGALVEHHLIKPAKVADWAEFFATEMENSADPANLEDLRKIAARLRDYARQLTDIVNLLD